ncbi:CotH kinase family protein [Brachybacterium sp. J153]|uniref:CotH kinase family protein n=1 Tax=Brachybacterium sp. J153 TaxID=3116488 RepID=UPI002E776DAD|nr:CotH kinase family protein [Brachybacterium sp. J153]MEE1619640.1 CotH kinase family protein [Brachybacterium sp. J153]
MFDAEWVGDDLTTEQSFATLGEFLQFLEESEDDEFASTLMDRFDVDGFAAYLAAQEMVANTDDIDGPGNNSYLHYDSGAATWNVVAWDHNLAFGGMGGGGDMGGGPGGFPEDGELSEGFEPPAERELPDGELPEGAGGRGGAAGGGGMGGGMGGNVLSERSLADSTFAALYDTALADLTGAIYTSGDAAARLQELVDLLTADASDLVTVEDLQSDAETITAVLEG